MATIIRGKELAQDIRTALKIECQNLEEKYGKKVCLAVIQVGQDPASSIYVNNKKKACQEVGIKSLSYQFENEGQEELLKLIEKLNHDDDVHGILCQFPLPQGYDEKKVISKINPLKDVDGFHPLNLGCLLEGEPWQISCTPLGVLTMLKSYQFPLAGKQAVIVGRSNHVGKPLALLLLQENCTVTVAHSKTKNLAEVCRRADILIAAVGKKSIIDASCVHADQIIIDVGINRDETGKVCGDVDFAGVLDKVKAISPVPNGVGPMTIACLLQNTVKSYRKILNIEKE